MPKVRTYGDRGRNCPRETDNVETTLSRLERSRYYSARVLRGSYQRYKAIKAGTVKNLTNEEVREYRQWASIQKLKGADLRRVLNLWVQAIENSSRQKKTPTAILKRDGEIIAVVS